jgi:hypothetical protein
MVSRVQHYTFHVLRTVELVVRSRWLCLNHNLLSLEVSPPIIEEVNVDCMLAKLWEFSESCLLVDCELRDLVLAATTCELELDLV